MKLRYLALALVTTMAGVASAHMVVPAPEPIRTQSAPKVASQPAPQAVLPKPSALPVRNASLPSETTRQPVPILLSHRRPVVAATDSYPPNDNAAPSGDMTELVAKAAIEADGYRGVHTLSRGPNGVWKARALRGAIEVLVSVDATGGVSAN